MVSLATTEAPAPDATRAISYAPSWFDRLKGAVERVPGPWWWPYVAGAAVLVALELAVKWTDGTQPFGTLSPYLIFLPIIPCYLLATIHALDRLAGRVLAECQPVLREGDTAVAQLGYQLTTMPGRPALLATLGGMVGWLVLEVSNALLRLDLAQVVPVLRSPAAAAIEVPLAVALSAMIGLNTYHGARQLHIINTIYTQHTTIDLFHLGPLYALARLPAASALVGSAIIYAELLAVPELLSARLVVVIMSSFLALALLVFIWPLWGIHRLLEQEKARLQAEANERIKLAIAELHRRTDAGTFATTSELRDTLDGLSKEHALLADLSTWPWQPDLARGLVTALLLPILLWLLTRLLEKVITF